MIKKFNIPSIRGRLLAKIFDEGIVLIINFPLWIRIFHSYERSEVLILHWGLVVYYFASKSTYEWFSTYFWGATIGKYLMGLRVIPCDHRTQHLGFSQALLRVLCNQLDIYVGWALYVVALGRFDRTHVADWIADTRVIEIAPSSPGPIKIYPFVVLVLFSFFLFQGLSGAVEFLQSFDLNWPWFYFFI